MSIHISQVEANIKRYQERVESLPYTHQDFKKFNKLLSKERKFLLELLKIQHQAPSPPHASTSFKYWAVSAKVRGCMTSSGYRKHVYFDACHHGALHDSRCQRPSIFYPEGSNDLHIALMFDSSKSAHIFLNCLHNYNNNTNCVMNGKFEIVNQVEALQLPEEGTYVLHDEYKSEHYESPSNTHDEFKSVSEVPFLNDPDQESRTLENLTLLKKNEVVHRCHIAPKGLYKSLGNDVNNIIFGSHLFHSYFDGGGARRHPDSDLGWGRAPQFKIEYHSTGDKVMKSGTLYHTINVILTFQDPECARALEGHLRYGTALLDDLRFQSFFLTTDVDRCIDYIAIKQFETEKYWGTRTTHLHLETIELNPEVDTVIIVNADPVLYDFPP